MRPLVSAVLPGNIRQKELHMDKNVIVLFEVTVKDDKAEAFNEISDMIRQNMSAAEGLLHFEAFSSLTTKNKIFSIGVWKDEESVAKWRNFSLHRMAQTKGRKEFFSDYTLRVVSAVRTYSMTDRAEAPEDSNQYFGL